ncbi:MAG: helix-turn-helix transcriptional regulator [Clostridia bacterium]|nr:helix-turn-helix transcriptional regulator [Clostridia bacterium]
MADTVYKDIRKRNGLTRDEVCDKASEMDKPIQPERLERIENGKFPITPEEVMLLAEIYKQPALCNHFCANECPIGEKYVPEIKVKDLAQIVLEMLSSLNSMKKSQERLIEITADGTIDDDEIRDFVFIQKELERISVTVEALQLWVEQMLADKKINIEKYNEIKGNDT